MLRRTRFSLSISEPRPKPTRKEWTYQWSLLPDYLFLDDPDEAEEYVQEWNFPYPGQKEFLSIDPQVLPSISMPLTPKHRFQRGLVTHLKQNVFFKEPLINS